MAGQQPTVTIEAELRGQRMDAQIVRFDIPGPTDTIVSSAGAYQLNMCLTPRPLNTRACYLRRWGPHRFERVGDIFLIPPGEELNLRSESGRQASFTCQIPAPGIAAIIGRDLAWTDRQLVGTLDISNARVRALLFRLTEEVRHPGFAATRMFEFLAGELAIEIARLCLEISEQPVTGGLAGWRLRLIDERLAEDPAAPSLADLARMCNLSVRQLTRGFRISRGCSIGDHIEQRRMEAAKRMLMAGENVKAISFALGFSSPSSFTYAFRRAVGASPSQFRQRQLRVLEMA